MSLLKEFKKIKDNKKEKDTDTLSAYQYINELIHILNKTNMSVEVRVSESMQCLNEFDIPGRDVELVIRKSISLPSGLYELYQECSFVIYPKKYSPEELYSLLVTFDRITCIKDLSIKYYQLSETIKMDFSYNSVLQNDFVEKFITENRKERIYPLF